MDDDWWECEECGYDKEESGGLDAPSICPLCAGDTGGDGRIRHKRRLPPEKKEPHG